MTTDKPSEASPFELAAREYMISRVIQAAAAVHLFTSLAAGEQSAESLARASRASVQGIQGLLTALRALNIVAEVEGKWRLRPEVAAQLPDEETLAGLVGGYRDWLTLEEAVRSGGAQAEPSYRHDAASMQQFLLGMHLSSLPVAQDLAAHLPRAPRHILDLGGGLGTYALAICQRFAGATATVLELPQVAAIGARLVAGSPLAERVRFLGGDYLADPFPSGNDLILMCNILHQEKPGAVRRLFRKAAASLAGAGWVVIHETLVDDDGSCSLAVALASLNSLLYYGGRNYGEGEVVKWLEAEGLVVRETRRTAEPGVRIIIAQRPGP